jgi:2-methylcitrate dehydratase PrpD
VSALAPLAEFAAKLRYDALPADIATKAQSCLLYGLAVAVASVRVPLASHALALGSSSVESGATRLVDGMKVGSGDAAFANAMLFHARIQEDAHPAGHVGVVVLPACLAQAQSARARGHDVLAAIAAGYEIALRIGRDHAADLSESGFRTTSVYGPIGAAGACARLRRSDAGIVANALSLAANTACGLREFVDAGSEEYAFQAGIAAHNAIVSTALACAGASAAPSVLEGAAGFYRAFGGHGRPYTARLADGLGVEWEFAHVTYKPYPVCQFHRSLIGGVLELRRQAAQSAFARMRIDMHPYEADFYGVRYAGPFHTFSQAFMSAPWCAALAWSEERVDYAGMTGFDSAATLALVRNIEVRSASTRPRYQPSISVTLADGRELTWTDARGPAAYMLDWDAAVRMSAQLCAEAGVQPLARERLVNTVAALAHDGEIAEVAAAASHACAAALERHQL